jgi:hypothetical protein
MRKPQRVRLHSSDKHSAAQISVTPASEIQPARTTFCCICNKRLHRVATIHEKFRPPRMDAPGSHEPCEVAAASGSAVGEGAGARTAPLAGGSCLFQMREVFGVRLSRRRPGIRAAEWPGHHAKVRRKGQRRLGYWPSVIRAGRAERPAGHSSERRPVQFTPWENRRRMTTSRTNLPTVCWSSGGDWRFPTGQDGWKRRSRRRELWRAGGRDHLTQQAGQLTRASVLSDPLAISRHL